MKVVYLILGFLLIGMLSSDTIAQSQIIKSIQFTCKKSDTTIYLGDWVISSSIFVTPDSIVWDFDASSGLMKLQEVEKKNVLVQYSVLPISLPKTISKYPRLEYSVSDDSIPKNEPTLNNQVETSIFDTDLTQSGSLSRGIIVGSNQDFALESGLNFELRGQLTNDISLDAVLTDQSIPIQPDGTTQSIREFDKVLIRLKSKKMALEMGDIDVSLNNSKFATLNRRLQGAAGRYTKNTGGVNAVLSSVRGTYATQKFQGQDGVQGPYRLKGKNGEEFAVILAGTERVYINGILVKRGEEYEYIIDYGLGEITFTNNIFIKDETRIYVEYEYINQDFNRTLIATEVNERFIDDKLTLGFSLIRQADGDDLLSQQTLTESDIQILKLAGDDEEKAILSGVIENPNSDEINIKYARIDTTLNGDVFTIFKNIPNSSESNLVVRFSSVGEGKGSYQRIGDRVNGLLYEWVGPGNGAYEPFRKLPAPKKHQMFALNSKFKVSKNITFSNEISLSDFDRNRFSNIDNGDNTDVALFTNVEAKEIELGIGSFDVNYTRRQSGKNFEVFERTRDVEFDRKWNVEQQDVSGEKLDEFNTKFSFLERSNVQAGIGKLRFSGFESIRQNADISIMESNIFSIEYAQEYISSKNNTMITSGQWLKQKGAIRTNTGSLLSSFIQFEYENLEEKNKTNILAPTSTKFFEMGPGLVFKNKHWLLESTYIFRIQDAIKDGKFKKESDSREQRYKIAYYRDNGFRTENEIHFRNKSFEKNFKEEGKTNQNGLQLASFTSYKSDRISARASYKANTQRKALRQEVYIEVGPELGQYVWVDENKNGIEEIDEFYLELTPNEGTYVLQFLPSDQLLPVIDLKSNFTFDWKPFQKHSDKSKNTSWYQSLTLNSNLSINENSTTGKEKDVYLLRLNTFRNDSTTVDGLVRFEQELLIQPIKNLDFKLRYYISETMNRRTIEVQRKKSDIIQVETSYLTDENMRFRMDIHWGNNSQISEVLSNRTYKINAYAINPGFTKRVSKSFQYGFNLGYSIKQDTQYGKVKAKLIKVQSTTRAFLWKRVQASTNIEFKSTRISGEVNPLTNYELTEGSGEGKNLLWAATINYLSKNFIRVNLNYNGRTVRNMPNIHILKLVLSARF